MDTDSTYFNVILNSVLHPKKWTSEGVPLLRVWEIIIQPLHIWEGLLPAIILLKGYANNELANKASPNITWTSVEPIYQHAPLKAAVHKMHVGFTIYIMESVNWVILNGSKMKKLCWTSYRWCRHTHFLLKLGQKFSKKCLQSSNNFSQFFLIIMSFAFYLPV